MGEHVPGGPSWAIRNNGLMLHSMDPPAANFKAYFVKANPQACRD